jgi:hypothetical protein
VKYFFKNDLSPKDIHVDLVNTLGESALSYDTVKRRVLFSALSPPEGRWLRYRELSGYMEAKLGEVMSERFISMGVAYRHFSIVTGKSVRR